MAGRKSRYAILTTHGFSETYNLYLKEHPDGRNGDTTVWDFMLIPFQIPLLTIALLPYNTSVVES